MDANFNKLFWFVVGLVVFGLGYMVALTFIPIPKENMRFADTSIGWVQGSVVTMAISFLLGGNAAVTKKPTTPDGKTTTEVNLTATTVTDETSKNKEDENI